MLRTAREAQRYVERNSQAIEDARKTLLAYGAIVQSVYERYARGVEFVLQSMGGLVHLQELTRAAGQVLVNFIKALPPYWPQEAVFDIQKAVDIANASVPVVWVPPTPVMTELVAADGYDAWLSVLRGHVDELRGDVARVLDEVTHHELAPQVPLARAALTAWNAGHGEAAQGLAVAVTEALVSRYFDPKRRGYKRTGKAAFLDLEADDGISISEIRLAVALAPISSFYTEWYSDRGDPMRHALSRHVTVHSADIGHYTPDSVLIAIFLQTSVLRAYQEVLEQRDLEAPTEEADVGKP
jgi:hypothetical protein